jgi:hypothetical protein
MGSRRLGAKVRPSGRDRIGMAGYRFAMALEAIDHVDLVVSSLACSLPFYEGRARPSPLAFSVASREIVDKIGGWARDAAAETEGDPREYDYTPGYYALFVHDPDGIKLEFVRRPEEGDLVLRVAALEARLAELEGER